LEWFSFVYITKLENENKRKRFFAEGTGEKMIKQHLEILKVLLR